MIQKKDKLEEFFKRGVGKFIDPNNSFRKKIESKIDGSYDKDIIVKFGVDPTRPDIHLGHAVIFRKLKELQDFGCKIVFIVGDFTALIGDPTGKSKIRPEIKVEEIRLNSQTYLDQINTFLDIKSDKKFEWLYNSTWYLSPTDYSEGNMIDKATKWENEPERQRIKKIRGQLPSVSLINILSSLRGITYGNLIERDMFQERIKNGKELYMHEMIYPILQGEDSNIVAGFFGSCDLEIGGTDQTFNMLMGRDLMKKDSKEPQSVMAMKILEGLDGKEKMSKSLDNYVSITDKPSDMFGKIMSIPDSSIENYFLLCTDLSEDKIKEIIKNNNNPRDQKIILATEIVTIYYSEDESFTARNNFANTFQKKEIPKDMEEVEVSEGDELVNILLHKKLITSKTDWRRLVSDGAVYNLDNDSLISETDFRVSKNLRIKIGKRRFLKIKTHS